MYLSSSVCCGLYIWVFFFHDFDTSKIYKSLLFVVVALIFLIVLLVFYAYACFTSLYVYAPCEYPVWRSWSHRWLGATGWVLGTASASSHEPSFQVALFTFFYVYGVY